MKTIDEEVLETKEEHFAISGVVEAAHATVIIGMGNMQRGDDAAGLHVARKLLAKNLQDAQVMELQGDGEELIAAWKDCRAAYLVTTVISGQRPGYVYRFDLRKDPLPEYLFSPCSNLGFELGDALEIALATNNLPEKLILYAIEGINFSSDDQLSREVEKGIQTVVQCLMIDLG